MFIVAMTGNLLSYKGVFDTLCYSVFDVLPVNWILNTLKACLHAHKQLSLSILKYG